MKINLDDDEKYTIVYALNMWRNYIQTGDVTTSPDLAKKILKAGKPILGKSPKIKALSEEQIEFLGKLGILVKKLEKHQ